MKISLMLILLLTFTSCESFATKQDDDGTFNLAKSLSSGFTDALIFDIKILQIEQLKKHIQSAQESIENSRATLNGQSATGGVEAVAASYLPRPLDFEATEFLTLSLDNKMELLKAILDERTKVQKAVKTLYELRRSSPSSVYLVDKAPDVSKPEQTPKAKQTIMKAKETVCYNSKARSKKPTKHFIIELTFSLSPEQNPDGTFNMLDNKITKRKFHEFGKCPSKHGCSIIPESLMEYLSMTLRLASRR